MKSLIFADNEKQLLSFLSKKREASKGCGYFSHVRLSPECHRELERLGYAKIPKPRFDQRIKEKFIQEYSALIGCLSRQQKNKRCWWATDTSSKNRFSSRLPMCLERFILIRELAGITDVDELIIIGQPWETIDALTGSLDQDVYRVIYLGRESINKAVLFVSRLRNRLAVGWNILKLLKRKYEAHSVLSEHFKKIKAQGKYDYLIKTFTYDHSFKENNELKEAFFGCLPQYLNKENKVLIFTNIIGHYGRCLRSIAGCREYDIIPYEMTIRLRDLLQAMTEAMVFSVTVNEEIEFFGHDISSILKRTVLEKIQFHQLMHYWSTKRLLEMIAVKTFFITYENYPWERMCIIAARASGQDMTVIGYQHTVVPQAFLNMFVSEQEQTLMPLPDKVFTTGEKPKNIIKHYGRGEISVESSCGLRFEHLFKKAPQTNGGVKTENILAPLEITLESFEMVEYLLNETKSMENVSLRIRTHPAMPWHRFEKRFHCNIEEYPNACVSNNSLEDDLQWADVVFYSGTTVGLEALVMGKPVIHFDRGSILSFDPLFECDDFKWTLSFSDSLKQVLEKINALTSDEFQDRRSKAIEYTRDYFFPMEEENLKKFNV